MEWKSELIEEIFMPSEAEIIKQIPLSYRRPQDILIWSGTKKGEFSVKSAYRLLQQRDCNGRGIFFCLGGKIFLEGCLVLKGATEDKELHLESVP
jgi:hypothetical protein